MNGSEHGDEDDVDDEDTPIVENLVAPPTEYPSKMSPPPRVEGTLVVVSFVRRALVVVAASTCSASVRARSLLLFDDDDDDSLPLLLLPPLENMDDNMALKIPLVVSSFTVDDCCQDCFRGCFFLGSLIFTLFSPSPPVLGVALLLRSRATSPARNSRQSSPIISSHDFSIRARSLSFDSERIIGGGCCTTRRVVDEEEDEERIKKQGAVTGENEHDLSASRRRVVAMM
jgi:hypothetical protein